MKKILAIIIIMTSSTLGGLHLSKAVLSRAVELEKIRVFIVFCKIQISYMAYNLDLIINSYIDEHKNNLPVFISEEFIKPSDDSIQEQILAKLKSPKVKNALKPGDIKCFETFISSLGKGDIESQISLCELYEKLICDRLKTAKLIAEKYAGLYTALSVLGGMAVSILLL